MFLPHDEKPIANSGPAAIDGATEVWDPALWAVYLNELVQEERRRAVN